MVMTRGRCCGCNGPMAVCKSCRCAKNKIACTSCYPGRKGNCENRAPENSPALFSSSAPSDITGSNSVINNTTTTNEAAHDSRLSSLLLDDFSSFQRGSVLDRVPKGSRISAAIALTKLVNNACNSNSLSVWRMLFRFSSVCFKKPKRGGKRQPSLATTIKRQIEAFLSDPLCPLEAPQQRYNKQNVCDDDKRAKLIARKLSNSDIKGAIRILSSDDSILPFTDDTMSQLRSKHPPSHPDSCFPSPPNTENVASALQLTESQVSNAILSFPGGSAGGCDLLYPQHLKDLTSKQCGEPGTRLLSAITQLCNKMLRGDIPEELLPFLYGASLMAFSKPDGGIRPIAIGNTLRRLTAKAAANLLKTSSKTKLFPHQVGVSVSGGAEAVVHAARSFCFANNINNDPVLLLKIDFENAFNSIRRDKLLRAVQQELGCLYPFIHQCYFKPTYLICNGSSLLSAEGVQQGDPLGPLCFSIAIQNLITKLTSELNVWYLDDGTLAGKPESVLSDFDTIIAAQEDLGLKVNINKCEFSVLGSSGESSDALLACVRDRFPTAKYVPPANLELLGTPLYQEALQPDLNSRLENFKVTCSRLEKLDHHDALFLLKNAFYIPKLLYFLRTSASYLNPTLHNFDTCMRSCLENITNVCFDDSSFRQATLPVKLGGLGVRRVADISLPAFISSCTKTIPIVSELLTGVNAVPFFASLSRAVHKWKQVDSQLLEPPPSAAGFQKSWDFPVAKLQYNTLLGQAPSDLDRSRLLAVGAPYAGAWLNAVPVPSLGLKLDNESLRISVALRLGAKLSLPYTCICGTPVEDLATHGLDCRRAAGKHARHSAVNDIIHRALSAAGTPSLLEPVGMCRSDGKRPDGATVIPWKQGKCLVWDFTCVNTICRSHLSGAALQEGFPSSTAEEKKRKKYLCLADNYLFTPIALETLGPWGPEAIKFISEVGRRLSVATGDQRSTSHLRQRMSVAVQRGNAMCITGSYPSGGESF